MHLVADASVLVRLALESGGFDLITSAHALHTPALGRSESLSALHDLRWRREVSSRLAARARDRLLEPSFAVFTDDRHPGEAWRVAEQAGWATTYDAEYVAAARLLAIPLLTLDRRLKRAAAGFVETLMPDEVA